MFFDSLVSNPLVWLALVLLVLRLIAPRLGAWLGKAKGKKGFVPRVIGKALTRYGKIQWRWALILAAALIAIALYGAWDDSQIHQMVNPTY